MAALVRLARRAGAGGWAAALSSRAPPLAHGMPRAPRDKKMVVALQELLSENERLPKGERPLSQEESSLLKSVFVLARSDPVRDLLLRDQDVPPQVYSRAVAKWRSVVRRSPSEARRLLARVDGLGSAATRSRVVEELGEFSREHFQGQVDAFKLMRSVSDLRLPHEWYPRAREIRRKVIYHAGPTNSGKTYNALQRLAKSRSGLYCGPLRLLALEVYEKMGAEGIYCDLITGQERRELPFSSHVSCTVETANLSRGFEVAVVDEIQMMSDPSRGWAWTRAILGLQCMELHVCGDPSAVGVIEKLCAQTGDELEVKEYSRLGQLQVQGRSLGQSYHRVQPGDAVVAFSRREIYAVKQTIEATTKLRCCVVYGQLPAETRSHQAKLFNTPGTGYDVLVASDAIGMGLNLNINRIIFHSMEKFDGRGINMIPPALVKQIAGRAGRGARQGFVTTFEEDDLAYLRQALGKPVVPLHQCGIFPTYEQFHSFLSQAQRSFSETVTLGRGIDLFAETARLDGTFFMCKAGDMKTIAKMLQPIDGLSLFQRFYLSVAPCNTTNPALMAKLYKWASALATTPFVDYDVPPIGETVKSYDHLRDYEEVHQMIDLWLWLSFKFEGRFINRDIALQAKQDANMRFQQALLALGRQGLKRRKRRGNRRPVVSAGDISSSSSNSNSSAQKERRQSVWPLRARAERGRTRTRTRDGKWDGKGKR